MPIKDPIDTNEAVIPYLLTFIKQLNLAVKLNTGHEIVTRYKNILSEQISNFGRLYESETDQTNKDIYKKLSESLQSKLNSFKLSAIPEEDPVEIEELKQEVIQEIALTTRKIALLQFIQHQLKEQFDKPKQIIRDDEIDTLYNTLKEEFGHFRFSALRYNHAEDFNLLTDKVTEVYDNITRKIRLLETIHLQINNLENKIKQNKDDIFAARAYRMTLAKLKSFKLPISKVKNEAAPGGALKLEALKNEYDETVREESKKSAGQLDALEDHLEYALQIHQNQLHYFTIAKAAQEMIKSFGEPDEIPAFWLNFDTRLNASLNIISNPKVNPDVLESLPRESIDLVKKINKAYQTIESSEPGLFNPALKAKIAQFLKNPEVTKAVQISEEQVKKEEQAGKKLST